MAKKKAATNSSKSLFDHVNALYTDQTMKYFDELSVTELKSYTPYMINRILSMNPVQAVIVNEMQKFSKISNRHHYMFYSAVLPKRKQYNKYIKNSKKKVPDWLVALLSNHYKIGTKEVYDCIDIYLMPDNVDSLIELCKSHGIEDKQLKELKIERLSS